ncbi:hypothetical protein NZ698_16405 [Chryseobacterium sp. PBS4-4]|uniref:Uncharacterized protein n=1 Tax=Chryseobacterium edaphi TaxID=2976532 RepID=A0ABT2W985_9FLAO|nr:hypothetical protein [Chryseobacterium edaphi]MCU7618778.1 hypothetical protein [Chryseobacterium edaphi]
MFEKGANVGDSESQNYFIEVLQFDAEHLKIDFKKGEILKLK